MRREIMSQRSVCPIACTLDILGDKWTLLIIRDLGFGRTQFKQFAAGPEKIATNILTDRLAKLVQHGIAERYPSPHQAGRFEYRLTDKGKALRPVLKAMSKWGLEHVEGTPISRTALATGSRDSGSGIRQNSWRLIARKEVWRLPLRVTSPLISVDGSSILVKRSM